MKNYYLHRLNSDLVPFELWDGVFTLGGGKMDDLTIAGLKEAQIRFVYVDGFISIQASIAPIWLDGRLITTFPFEVGPTQVLSLNADTHLVFNLSATECDVKAPTLDASAATSAPVKYKFDIKKWNWVIIGMILAMVCVGTLVMVGTFLTKNNTIFEPLGEPAPAATISDAQVEQYIQRIVGKNLISLRKEGSVYYVRVVAGEQQQERRWLNDLDNLLQSLPKDVEVNLDIVPMEKLMLHVKQDMQVIDNVQNVHVQKQQKSIHVRAIVGSSKQADEVFEKIKANYPFLTFTSQFHELHINFQILALTVSRHNASVTIARKDQTLTIAEGGYVPDLGTLKLIKHNGLVVATSFGEVFVPWTKTSI